MIITKKQVQQLIGAGIYEVISHEEYQSLESLAGEYRASVDAVRRMRVEEELRGNSLHGKLRRRSRKDLEKSLERINLEQMLLSDEGVKQKRAYEKLQVAVELSDTKYAVPTEKYFECAGGVLFLGEAVSSMTKTMAGAVTLALSGHKTWSRLYGCRRRLEKGSGF